MNRPANKVDFHRTIDWINRLAMLLRQNSSQPCIPADKLVIAAENLADACRIKIYQHEKEGSHE